MTASLSMDNTAMPVADGLPVLGSALSLLKNPLEFMLQQRRKHGDVYRIEAGHRSMVVLSGVDANRFMNEEGRQLLVSKDFWGRLTEAWNCPHMLSALDGDAHIADRRFLKSSFNRTVAADKQGELIDLIRDTVDGFVKENGEFSARELTRSLTNKELYLLLTGEEPDIAPGLAKALAEYQRITFNVLMLGKWPRIMLFMPHYLYYKWRSTVFVRDLQKRFEQSPPDSGFFKLIMELYAKRGDWTKGDYEMGFLSPFWAGLDTLGASLTFLLHELLHNPEAAQAVRDEVLAAVAENNGEIPDIAELGKLPQLYGFCMEILRLHPVAFGMGRSAADDFEFKGHKVRKGEQVLVFTAATHFDPQYFPEPEKFDTSRYLEKQQHKERLVFNPFGRGPHICLAAGMAEGMLLTTVATMLNDYDIQDASDGRQFSMIFDPSPTLPNSFRVRMKRRAA